jgi:hypothetical protein
MIGFPTAVAAALPRNGGREACGNGPGDRLRERYGMNGSRLRDAFSNTSHAMLHCKKALAQPGPAMHIVHRSMTARPPFCFLGRFLPKLGGATMRRHFFFLPSRPALPQRSSTA